jgi:hypothetical protein
MFPFIPYSQNDEIEVNEFENLELVANTLRKVPNVKTVGPVFHCYECLK